MFDFSVIGIVGLQASGKTLVASHLIDLGASRVRMGDVVWREVKNRKLEINEENVANVAKELREREGMGAIAERCIPIIKKKGKKSETVVVDGLRGGAEVEVFRNEFGESFFLISVEAPDKLRYDRIKRRGREDDIEDFESFKEKDERELDWGMEEAMESADFTIINNGSVRDLKIKVSKIFGEITENESRSES
ncbi:hypothetical protein AKJ62_00330 [candidate division MSBL1 archaeon SCGC-AAA259D14]|uniref:Dephospho-CoA kinase n=2 Tax=candidate division MSBL1 TaxID=215777 RepID=A0A133U8Y7_9EURY|nr:hypothetical protein AKJ62_00330 [candidate division MSBL1 archaeon SCGC-AAA259D14]KXA93845.1 hypothetical protein AKJ66_00730 [candidate division MSBL1 archaeon SCGC-AAA259E22]